MEDRNNIEYTNYINGIKKELDRSYSSKNRIKLILRLYSYLGILTAIISILYFMLSLYDYRLSANQQIAVMTAGVGLVVSIFSKIYNEILKDREKEQLSRKNELEKISNFILDWATFERTTYTTLEKYFPVTKFSIKQNIRTLYDENIISDREYINLEKALDIRNRTVHGEIESTQENLDKYSELINEVIDKILIYSKKRN